MWPALELKILKGHRQCPLWRTFLKITLQFLVSFKTWSKMLCLNSNNISCYFSAATFTSEKKNKTQTPLKFAQVFQLVHQTKGVGIQSRKWCISTVNPIFQVSIMAPHPDLLHWLWPNYFWFPLAHYHVSWHSITLQELDCRGHSYIRRNCSLQAHLFLASMIHCYFFFFNN